MQFKEENRYLAIAQEIVETGYEDKSRTGINIKKLHSCHMEFSLLDSRVPILSSRKVPFKSAIIELLWFISGSTDVKFLKDNNVGIWDEWVITGTDVWRPYSEQEYATAYHHLPRYRGVGRQPNIARPGKRDKGAHTRHARQGTAQRKCVNIAPPRRGRRDKPPKDKERGVRRTDAAKGSASVRRIVRARTCLKVKK
jgi:hypothetical protein